MSTIKRLLAVTIVILLMILQTVGCGSNPGGGGYGDNIFIPETVTIPGEFGDITHTTLHDGKVFFVSGENLGGEISSIINRIFSVEADGTNLTEELTGYTPAYPADKAITGIRGIRVDNDGYLWINESGYFYRFDLPDGFDDEEESKWAYAEYFDPFNMFRKLDSIGAEILTVELAGFPEISIESFEMGNDGNIYINSTGLGQNSSTVYVFDSDGILKFTLDAPGRGSTLIKLSDGSVALVATRDAPNYSTTLTKINTASGTWADEAVIPFFTQNIHTGADGFDVIVNDGSRLFGVELETGETVEILNWTESMLAADFIKHIGILPDGRIICVERRFNRSSGVSILNIFELTKTDRSNMPEERTVFTFATFGLSSQVESTIAEFNRTNRSYMIQVVDYSEFSTSDDWRAGLTRLNTEIISGRMPDIMDLGMLPCRMYVTKGLLIDMYDIIDSDPEFDRSSFMEGALRAAETDGGLHYIFPLFTISTIIGNPSVLGSDPGWNMDEFKAVIEANPGADMPVGTDYTKESFLNTMIGSIMDEYVDWAAGTVNFNSECFVQLLEFADTLPSDFLPYEYEEHELVASGRQIMSEVWAYSGFDPIQKYRHIYGGDLVFKGFPVGDRNGNILNPYYRFAITAGCKDMEGAWQFLRTFLTKEWYLESFPLLSSVGFPLNREVYDMMLTETMAENRQISWTLGTYRTTSIDLQPTTRADADMVLSMINSLTIVNDRSFGFGIHDIVMEGAKDYFNGRNTAAEAARIIQSRASIFMAEQSG